MRRLLREPLLHFLVGGSLLFVLYQMVADDPAYAPDRIVVDEARVANLSGAFERTWMRLPTRNELDGLVREFVNEEILYREALALGLDRNDIVIRRRMRQKMEFLHADLSEEEDPSEEELASFLAANRDRFREHARISFRHVYVDPKAGPAPATARASEALRKLQAEGPDVAILTVPNLLPEKMEEASEREIASVFGSGFATDVLALSGDGWTGPVASSYGLHLVRVDARVPARMPALDEIRRHVEREYESVQRAEASQRYLQRLRDQYEIEIRVPGVDSTPPSTRPES